MQNNSLTRNSFTLRATQKIGKILDLDGSLNYSITNSKNPMRNGSNENPLFALVYYRPRHADLDYYYSDYIDPTGGPKGRATQQTTDPYLLTRNAFRLFTDNRMRKENNLIANIDLTTKVTPWLSFLLRTNANIYNDWAPVPLFREEDMRYRKPHILRTVYRVSVMLLNKSEVILI
jgi:iron complex outermembrane receptor protein